MNIEVMSGSSDSVACVLATYPVIDGWALQQQSVEMALPATAGKPSFMFKAALLRQDGMQVASASTLAIIGTTDDWAAAEDYALARLAHALGLQGRASVEAGINPVSTSPVAAVPEVLTAAAQDAVVPCADDENDVAAILAGVEPIVAAGSYSKAEFPVLETDDATAVEEDAEQVEEDCADGEVAAGCNTQSAVSQALPTAVVIADEHVGVVRIASKRAVAEPGAAPTAAQLQTIERLALGQCKVIPTVATREDARQVIAQLRSA